jgi:hypothetical protein
MNRGQFASLAMDEWHNNLTIHEVLRTPLPALAMPLPWFYARCGGPGHIRQRGVLLPIQRRERRDTTQPQHSG